MPDLAVENVVKEFPTRGEPLVVLRGATLSLSAGENLAILGPSGSGKSTLLYIIGTLDQATSGRVELQGQDTSKLGEPQLADFRNQRIGFVFQDHHLLPQCSLLENVLLPTIANGAASTEAVARAKMLLDRVGLSGRLDHRPAELSGGERRRGAMRERLSTALPCCWPTSLPATWIAPVQPPLGSFCSRCSERKTRCWSSSHTVRSWRRCSGEGWRLMREDWLNDE